MKKENNKISKILSENDKLKFEIAKELGLMDKVQSSGWKSLTAKESGKIGGLISKYKRIKKETTSDIVTQIDSLDNALSSDSEKI